MVAAWFVALLLLCDRGGAFAPPASRLTRRPRPSAIGRRAVADGVDALAAALPSAHLLASAAAEASAADSALAALGRDIFTFLAASVTVVPVSRVLGVTPVLGLLAVGCAIGPYGLELFSNTEADLELGDFGILFLLFNEGLNLSPERLRDLGSFLKLGASQLAISIALFFFGTLIGGPLILQDVERIGIPLDDAILRPILSSPVEAFCIAAAGALKEKRPLNVVVKGDVQGSVEALRLALEQLVAEDDIARVQVKVLAEGVGEVTRNDVAVAAVSGAKILAFNVGANFAAQEDARRAHAEIGYYSVVYEVLEEIEAKMQDVLSPTPDGELVGTAVVKQCFDIGKLGKVAGCGVETGWIRKSANIRVMRGDAIMYQGRLRTLRSVKVDVERIDAGSDCGLSFRDWEEVEVGDVVEAYEE